uniref:Uncharacterized protein n=1 Tax=Anopheles culicifacies TaxID=139723 RepID=A0A182LVQ9_9DIPT
MSGAPIAARRRSEEAIDGPEEDGRPSASPTGSEPNQPARQPPSEDGDGTAGAYPSNAADEMRRIEFCNSSATTTTTTTAGPDVVTNPVRLVVVRVRHRDDNIKVHLHTYRHHGGRGGGYGGGKCVPLRKDWCRMLCPGMISIFGVPMDRHHTTWENRDEPWIYKDGLRIPKKFRNDIVDTIYMRISYMSIQEATRDFYRLLKDSYRRYIRLAKGIEKMKEDLENVQNKAKYKRYEIELLNQVREEVRLNLQQVLCEIFEVLVVIDKKFLFQTLREDHAIDINDSFLDESERKLRDWTIYRELINQLEYIIQYMKALEQRRTLNGNQSTE